MTMNIEDLKDKQISLFDILRFLVKKKIDCEYFAFQTPTPFSGNDQRFEFGIRVHELAILITILKKLYKIDTTREEEIELIKDLGLKPKIKYDLKTNVTLINKGSEAI